MFVIRIDNFLVINICKIKAAFSSSVEIKGAGSVYRETKEQYERNKELWQQQKGASTMRKT